ncbi:MAG: twin-arginine translocation signal domain-containing protein [Lachnospiraceae bacterium]|nr:twin-arginine translocation signal domain-containing protein [Lachnospiraceae bacterium]
MKTMTRRTFLKASAIATAAGMAMANGVLPVFAEEAALPALDAYPITPEEFGSGEVKYKVEETEDGWVKVINEGGATLGYSKKSGVQLIQVNGYAFKDLNRDGKLDLYEDWRQPAEERAKDLAGKMSGEQIAPYLTHGGWGSFTTSRITEDNSVYGYVVAGGRGGVTRQAGSDTKGNVDHAKWSNLLQELCETQMFGIPAVVSIDPNGQSGIAQCLSLAASMDPELAFEVGKEYSKQYRAMGISMLLGPQIDLMTSPVMDRGNGTYGEDPALVRDIAEAFVSGMQSTFDEEGNDLGWGAQSVVCDMKHFAGAGAAEGGRDDHRATGKYDVFPNNNFEAHLIAFFDGAFNLKHSITGAAGGIMTNYAVSYSDDYSLGEYFGGAYSEYKYELLKKGGWNGYIISDWGVYGEGGGGSWGTEGWEPSERLARTYELGMCQAGGYSNTDETLKAWELMKSDMGEEKALETMRDRACKNILMTLRLGLFENPYCSLSYAEQVCCTEESRAFGLKTRLASVVMLKNNGLVKKAEEGAEKKTVYIPYRFNAKVVSAYASSGNTPASWTPCMDLETAGKFFNVVTDTVGEPSGMEEDKAVYTEKDIVRASAEDIAKCDMIVVAMNAPHTASNTVTDEEGYIEAWLPPSIQYNEYTAVNAKATSVAGDLEIIQIPDGYYGYTTREEVENRSYKGETAAASNLGHLQTLEYCKEIAGDKPVVVLMNQNGSGSMCWGEVEPLADVILTGYAAGDDALLTVLAGQCEPKGLLVCQMPKDMDAVEASADDLPRDMECYVDAAGNTYDFAFGLDWAGVIDDERTKKYKAEPLTKCENLEFFYAE